MSDKTVLELLHVVQKTIKAPKSKYNAFGKYKYRNCEDVLEGVKSVLPVGAIVTLADELVQIGNRYYVKSTASFVHGSERVESFGWAREPDTKKGMDEAQITGSASSYARKIALSGLLALDDSDMADIKDADETNTHGKRDPRASELAKSIKYFYESKDGQSAKEVVKSLSGYEKTVIASMLTPPIIQWLKTITENSSHGGH